MVEINEPYIPGFLAFREADPLLNLIQNQRANRPEMTPDAILVDGNGILHSGRFGLACHLGVRSGLSTIGVAKNLYQMNEEGLLRDEDHQRKIEALEKAGDHFDLIVNR